jgi:hypothetical protein
MWGSSLPPLTELPDSSPCGDGRSYHDTEPSRTSDPEVRVTDRVAAMGAVAAAATLLLCGTADALAAQEATRLTRWSLAVGVVHRVQSDELASPLRYSGLGPGIRFAYFREEAGSRAGLGLDYAGPRLASAITQGDAHSTDTHRTALTASYLRRVAAMRGGQVSLFLGGTMAVDGLYRNHSYGPVGGRETFVDVFATLAPAGGWEALVGPRLRLSHRVASPVLGAVWRTPYTGMKYFPDARLARIPTLLGLEHELALELSLSPTVDLVAAHHLSALKHPDPWRFATLTNWFRVGLELRRRRGDPAAGTPGSGDGDLP